MLTGESFSLPIAPSLLPEPLQRAWNAVDLIFGEQQHYAGFEYAGKGPWGRSRR